MNNSRLVIKQITVLAVVMAVAAVGPSHAESLLQRIAVLDFHDSSTGRATPEEVLYLSDLVRGVARRVLPADRYLLMTRENIQEMLPQGRTLADCVGDCAVDTGRKLGVDYVVTGEVTSFGGQIRVTVNLHGMQTGNLIDQVRAGAPNVLGVEKDLEEQARALLLKLRVPAPSDTAAPDPVTAPGNTRSEPWSATGSTRVVVSFTSDPAGAIVEIDGQPLGETPCKRALATGVYQLGLKKVRYVAHEQSLEVRAGVPPAVAVTLTPDFGWLTIESDPAGLSVTVDGEDWGATPVQAREVGTGPHDVQVGSVNHYAEARSITIDRGERESVRVAPVPRNGGLTVIATDAAGNATDAQVVVDGSAVGQAYQSLTVIQGTHQVSVDGPVGAWKGEVVIAEKQTRELAVQLTMLSNVVKLVEIPAGELMMDKSIGNREHDSDKALRKITIKRSIYMSATKITQAQYESVMGQSPSGIQRPSWDHTPEPPTGSNMPVTGVSWFDAIGFCNRLSEREGLKPAYRLRSGDKWLFPKWDQSSPGYRLPTEVEWEYACRAATYGLNDLTGNGEEWCWDWFSEPIGRRHLDGSTSYDEAYRVTRGGDCANRGRNSPEDSTSTLGFRVVRNGARK